MTPPKKTIEETYKKVSQREHVLLRANMYIGSPSKHVEELWTIDNGSEARMSKAMVDYSPGFLKIFDEVLTNALDHSNRDETVDKIKLDYNTKSGEIVVYNNGKGIPVVKHKDHGIYVPELIFGHLLSSSNYDDTEKRTGAGVNGLGVKLANIYSKSFVIETIDSDNGLKYVQEFTNNMKDKSEPKITKNSGKSYTKISFTPDYSKFGMKSLEKDTVLLLNKRIFDCIACTSPRVNVYLNGEKIKGKGLIDYIKYFFEENDAKRFYDIHTIKNDGLLFVWEYSIIPWERFEHVSFVNGNSTYQGGKHVDHIMNQIVSKLKVLLETKKKLKDIKPSTIKERMFLFLRATVVNPQFSSQTKEYLTTQSKDFGCKIEVSDKFIDKLWKSSIIEELIEYCKLKESLDLAKSTDGKKKSKIYIPKLEDALWAGTAKSDLCTLILTEGDSAKTFALWGRAIVGPEKFGVFPLKGKALNVRDATIQQLINNEEINNLKQIIGLKQDTEYKDTSDLRYGKVMVLTDADVDGSHIKGLLINFFHAQWPSLIKKNFIQTLKTPIVKAIKGKQVIEFYTEQDYNKWKESTGTDVSKYQIRYYKGLGTSTKEDAKNTFKKFSELTVDYYHKNAKCDESILLAFEKDKNVKTNANEQVIKCSDKRKKWLSKYDKNSYLDIKETKVSYQDFINKELVHFSIYDNLRSIPSLCDGLKPSQRKILFYMLKKNITQSIKVAQLSGYVSAETSYHHGEASLQQAIVGMAQNFVGSNNINLLFPDGNHGSRLSGGKDAASPRYIFTRLSEIAQHVFHPHDTPLLRNLNDDGMQIEPEWYIPVIPMILINGCEGIGTGYSTYIPPHNPKDIIANILRLFDDKEPLPMKPYFQGFNGRVEDVGSGNYVSYGKWERLSDCQIKITELPIGSWVTTYKEYLESFVENGVKKDKDAKKKKNGGVVLKDIRNQTKDENEEIDYIVEFKNKADLDNLIKSGTLEKELKLSKCFNTNNMYLFDDSCIPTKYATALDILLDFYDVRLDFYTQRKKCIVNRLEQEMILLNSKARFIEDYITGVLDINKKSKEYIINLLEERKFHKVHNEGQSESGGFDYLIKLPIISMTLERIESLKKQILDKTQELVDIKLKSNIDLWKEDLKIISKCLK